MTMTRTVLPVRLIGPTCWRTARAASDCAVWHCPSRPLRTSRSTRTPGSPALNLRTDFRCGIHTQLRDKGFRGCTVYDCFGAGQQVAQVTFGGQDWRQAPGTARQMFEVFPVMRQLHELLWYLTEALTLAPAGPLRAELARALEAIERLTAGQPGRSPCARRGSAPQLGQRAAAAHQRTRPITQRPVHRTSESREHRAKATKAKQERSARNTAAPT